MYEKIYRKIRLQMEQQGQELLKTTGKECIVG
jgi:hypothetical protein